MTKISVVAELNTSPITVSEITHSIHISKCVTKYVVYKLYVSNLLIEAQEEGVWAEGSVKLIHQQCQAPDLIHQC